MPRGLAVIVKKEISVKQMTSAQSDHGEQLEEDYHCKPYVPVKQTTSVRLKSATVHECMNKNASDTNLSLMNKKTEVLSENSAI